MKNPLSNCFQKTLSLLLTTILILSTLSGQVLATNPKVSIVIPVYNTPQNLLRDCLESAKNQTLKDIEIICVDDGSTNGVGNVLDEYAKNDPRFKVVHQENGGTCIARDTGLELAEGEFVQFLDHDDTIDLTMSEKCYNAAKKYDADIVKCSNGHIFRWRFDRVYLDNRFLPKIGDKLNISICNGIWRTKFLKDHKLKFHGLVACGEDWSFNIMASSKKNKICIISEELYNHVKNDSSQMHSTDKNSYVKRHVSNVKLVFDYFRENELFSDNCSKCGFLIFFVNMNLWKNNRDVNKLFIDAIDPELLQDDVINLLPIRERQQLRNIIQAAKSE